MEFMALSMALAINFAFAWALVGAGPPSFALVSVGRDMGKDLGMLLIKRLPDSLWIHKLLCTNAKGHGGGGGGEWCVVPPAAVWSEPATRPVACPDQSSLINELADCSRQRLIRWKNYARKSH